MKTFAQYILGAGVVASCLTALCMSCSSDEDFFYRDEPRIRLAGPHVWTAGTDSLTFSFVGYPATTTEMAMRVEALVMGEVADHDRTAAIEVVADRTTATPDLYDVPTTVTIPAGSNAGSFTVSLKRTDALKQRAARLYLRAVGTADFKTGVNEENHLTLIWNDILSKPNNWAELEPFFGAYSDTKYRFMLEHAGGQAAFSAETMSWAQLNSYRIRFQNELNSYNAAHPGTPLTDENGQLVTF